MSLVAEAYLTNLPNLSDNLITLTKVMSAVRIYQSAMSLSLASKLACLLIQEQQQTFCFGS